MAKPCPPCENGDHGYLGEYPWHRRNLRDRGDPHHRRLVISMARVRTYLRLQITQRGSLDIILLPTPSPEPFPLVLEDLLAFLGMT